MMLDKKQIQEIFLCEFERGHKQWWQLATSTIHLTQELLTDLQWSGASASFAKESRALKMRSRAAGHWKLTTIDWELSIIETDSLTVTREVAEELNIDHSKVVWHLKQIGMVKNLIAGCLVSWLQIKKKNHHFEVSSLTPCNSNEPFLDWIVTCDENWILYHSLQWLAQWWTKKFQSTSPSQIAPKEGHGHCLEVCCQSDPQQLSESWQNHCVWEAHSANRWDALKSTVHVAGLGQ